MYDIFILAGLYGWTEVNMRVCVNKMALVDQRVRLAMILYKQLTHAYYTRNSEIINLLSYLGWKENNTRQKRREKN